MIKVQQNWKEENIVERIDQNRMFYEVVAGVDPVHLQALQEEKVIHCLKSPKIKGKQPREVNILPSSISPVIAFRMIALSIEMFE